MKMKNNALYLTLHCLWGIRMVVTKVIFARENATVTLVCPSTSSVPIIWLGPLGSEIDTYSVGKSINKDIAEHDKLMITGNYTTGEYNLQITDFSRSRAGKYQCQGVFNGKAYQNTLWLRMSVKPKLIDNATSFLYETIMGKPIELTFLVTSSPAPTVSWSQISGGKLGFWTVKRDHQDTFKITSTIVPTTLRHFGKYGISIRNKAGNIEIFIDVVIKDIPITIKPANISCNSSSHISLCCSIKSTGIDQWTNKWIHKKSGIFIRNIIGTITGNTSRIELRYCDYRDSGKYTCIWTSKLQRFSETSIVAVNSPPVITVTKIKPSKNGVFLDVFLYSESNLTGVYWFRDENPLEESSMYQQFTTTSTVILNYTDTVVKTRGYNTKMFISNFNEDDMAAYSCQIQNEFGSTEASFGLIPLQTALQASTLKPSSMTNSLENYSTEKEDGLSREGQSNAGYFLNYFIIGGATILVLTVLIVAILCIHIRSIRKAYESRERYTDLSGLRFPHTTNSPNGPAPVAVYEEINNIVLQDNTEEANVSTESEASTSDGENYYMTIYPDMNVLQVHAHAHIKRSEDNR